MRDAPAALRQRSYRLLVTSTDPDMRSLVERLAEAIVTEAGRGRGHAVACVIEALPALVAVDVWTPADEPTSG